MGYKELELIQKSSEWKTWRNQGIGASDAPTIMGENKYKSPAQLLYEKKNNISPRKNIKMIKGSNFEAEARRKYIGKFNIQVFPLCIESIEFPWLRASLDGISQDRCHLVEIKCGESAYNHAKRGRVPKYSYGQLQHQIMITGLDTIQYWCILPRRLGIRITIKRNNEYIEKLFENEKKFFDLLSSP